MSTDVSDPLPVPPSSELVFTVVFAVTFSKLVAGPSKLVYDYGTCHTRLEVDGRINSYNIKYII